MPEGYNGLPNFYVMSSDPLTPNLGLSLAAADPIIAENMWLIDQFFGGTIKGPFLPLAGGILSGNLTLDNTLTDDLGSVGISGQLLSSTSTGVKWITASGTGTVTSFSSGNLSPLFTTSVASPVSTPALSFGLSSAAQNAVFAGPVSGGSGTPSYRALAASDIPDLSGTYLPLAGGALTGNLTLDAELIDGSSSAGISGYILSSTGTKTKWIVAPASGVSSLNSLTGALTLVEGSNITITPSGSDITIASSGGGGGGLTIVSKSINYTANTLEDVWCTNTITITLPATSGRVNVYNQGSGVITVAPQGVGGNVNGNSTMGLAYKYTSGLFSSPDGTNWNVE